MNAINTANFTISKVPTEFVDEWPERDQEMEHRQILNSKVGSSNNKRKNHKKMTSRIRPKSETSSYAQVADQ